MYKSSKAKKYHQYQNMLKNNQAHDDPNNTVTDVNLLSRNYIEQEDSKQTSSTDRNGNFVTEFDFDCKKVLHLWLALVIPGPSYIGLHYNFSQRKIWGPRGECLNKVSQCHVFLQERKMKLCTDLVLENNHEMYLKIKLDILIFKRQYVEAAYEELVNKQKFWELKKEIEPILRRKNIYLMSILKKEEQDFEIVMKDCSKDITREQIKKAMVQKQQKQKREAELNKEKMKKKYKPVVSSEDQVSLESDVSQKPINEQDRDLQQFQKLSQNKKLTAKQQKVKQQTNESLPNKQAVFTKQYAKSVLDLQKFQKWIDIQKNLNIKEFVFNIKQQTIEVCLYTDKIADKKVNTINFYLHNSKFQLIEDQQKAIVQKMKKKIEEIQKSVRPVTLKLIDGYVKQGADQTTIKSLFRDKKIKHQPTRNENKKVSFVHISGIKPNVDFYYDKVQNQIKSNKQKEIKKLEETIMTENIILSLGKVQDYLSIPKVKDLIKSVIIEVCKKLKFVKLQSVLCPFSKMTIKISVPEHQFKECKQYIQKQLIEEIYCNQVSQYQNVSAELLNKYLICRSIKDSSKAILIENKNRAIAAIQEITNEAITSTIEQAEIFVKCNRVNLIKKFKDDLFADSTKSYVKNCKIIINSSQNQSKIEILGNKKNVSKIENEIIEYLSMLDHEMLEKTLIINDIEANVVEKNINKFQNRLHKEQDFSFSLSKNLNIGCIISLGASPCPSINDSLVVYIHKQKTISCLPAGTTITFLSQEDFDFVQGKIFQQVKKTLCCRRQGEYKDSKRDYQYYIFQNYKSLVQGVSYPFKKTIKSNRFIHATDLRSFAFFMPKDNKSQFIMEIINTFYKCLTGSQIKIFIFEKFHSKIQKNLKQIDIVARKCLEKTQTKYYVIGEGKKMFYSATGQKKIKKALQDGQKNLFLYNSDLNLTDTTFLCSFKEEKLKHILTQKEMPLKILPSKVTFILSDIQFEIPKQQVEKIEKTKDMNHWVEVSIGVYYIDLETMIQTNLISYYQRKVCKQQAKAENPYGNFLLKIDYDFKVNEIAIEHKPHQDYQAEQACKLIRKYIQQQKITKKYTGNQKIDQRKQAKIKQLAQNYSLQVVFQNQKEITLKGFDKYLLDICIKNIADIISQQESKKCVYPQFWQHQKQDIQTFVISVNSKQFQQIQAAFQIGPVKQLIRIQNKVLYQKFYDEWQSLIRLNDGPVKQAKLYHGTNKTAPKCIYDDKEESFNINYTDDNNYLGKAIYFAEKAKYSFSYAHRDQVGLKSMFYCSVLVGDSQKFTTQSSQTRKMRDTSFKNPIKRLKYQSSSLRTSKGQIYAIYKSRRAYPLYLIKF